MRQVHFLPLMCLLCSCIHVEVRDEQSGYMLIMEGEAASEGKQLIINPLQILHNNLTPQENIAQILEFSGFSARLKLNDLQKLSSPSTESIQLKWISRKRINIMIKASKQDPINESLFDFIRKFTHTQLQDF